jgi:heparinase II/III-like protein
VAILKYRELLRRAVEKPPRVLLWKGWHLLIKHARRVGYWEKLDYDLRQEIERIPPPRLRQNLIAAPQLVCQQQMGFAAEWLIAHCPGQVEEIVSEANDVLAFRWHLLGHELHCQGFPVPWCTDWRVGYTWLRKYYTDVDYAALGAYSDVKYPWELSRFYFVPTLGQAYSFTGDRKYERQFVAIHRDWTKQNPVAWSINWCSPLEVALRSVHLATAVSFFPDLVDSDLRFLVHQLAVHAAFLYRNIEYTDIRGNHYAGNLYGLLVLGCLLDGIVSEARRWRAYAGEHVDSEILLQFYPDGVNFEKSTHYHNFVLEMFIYCALLLQRSGCPISPAARDRLLSALDFTQAYLRPDGSAPLIGDTDGGCALHIAPRTPRDHRGTLSLGSAVLGRFPSSQTSQEPAPECLWLLGHSSLNQNDEINNDETPLSFQEGGYLVSKGNGCSLLFDVGEVGQRGRGGHGHLDTLSFELSLDGIPILVDPGMPTYTGDIRIRNRFRGTAAHNTALVDQAEQGSLWPERSWRLGNEAHVSEVEEHRMPHEDCFAARHHGFERLHKPVRYHRRLVLNRAFRCFRGLDTFEGDGTHLIQIFFHVALGITLIQEKDKDHIILQSDGHSWFFSAEGGSLDVVEGEVSPAYGVRLAAPVIELRAKVELPAQITYAVRPFRHTLNSRKQVTHAWPDVAPIRNAVV